MINITQNVNCTGCHACKSICPKRCISMESDSEGFLYPKVDIDNCIDCGLCEKICPIIHKRKNNNSPKAYACYNINERIRMESSSGGLFTLIAEQIISNNGIVFGVRFDNDFNAIHDSIECKDELYKFRGSKYVQSSIGNTYEQVKKYLNQGRMVLFSGTPCQISGLRSFLGHTFDNLLCIDIVCHGVPSPRIWRKYLDYCRKNACSTPGRISFRDKNEGWKRYSVSFLFHNNTEYRNVFYKDLYMKTFLKNICLRPSCYACQFKTLHRESDITLADFWGVQDILPEMDDDKGTSLIFVNSDKGHSMLEQIKNDIRYKEVDIHHAIRYNPASVKSAEYNPKRKYFFDDVDRLPFDQLVRKYCTDNIAVKIKVKLKTFIFSLLKKVGLLNVYMEIFR